MMDLNDMLYFAEVVERGGFASAGRALGIPKSRLSRRVAELEARLGVRLLQRTTRKLSLTQVGEAYLRHWQAQCPMYADAIVAVLGGWHFPWPEGDWEALRERPLLAWTLEDAEPWVEVWGGGAAYQVMQRVT